MSGIVVVGGGVAGLACAARLAAGGRKVTLFERSHRVGGRVSTRVAGGLSFNHGAQFIPPGTDGFARMMNVLREQGAVLLWPEAGEGRWTGVPLMSAIPAVMARRAATAGVTVVLLAEVMAVLPGSGGWHIQVSRAPAAGMVARPEVEVADVVVIAVPAPSAARLLGVVPVLAARLAGVTMAPCWTLMLGLVGRIDAPGVLRPETGPVSWASCDSARPGAPDGLGIIGGRTEGVERWVVQAGSDWSRARLDRSADEVAAELLQAFAGLVGDLPRVVHSVATLWRQARAEQALGEPCLWDPVFGLGACGDWCLGAQVDAAWMSGDVLAGRILSDGRALTAV